MYPDSIYFGLKEVPIIRGQSICYLGRWTLKVRAWGVKASDPHGVWKKDSLCSFCSRACGLGFFLASAFFGMTSCL